MYTVGLFPRQLGALPGDGSSSPCRLFEGYELTGGSREMKIVAVWGDITQVDVDAVVCAEAGPREIGRRNDELVRQAGQEVESEAQARGPIHVGEAMLTTGGRLRCKYVIHPPKVGTSEAPRPEGGQRSTPAARPG